MKVLHIIDYHPDYHLIYGGAEIATIRLTKELEKRDIENFFLITWPDKKSFIPKNIIPIKTIYNYIDFKNPRSLKSKIISNLDFLKSFLPLDMVVLWKCRKILKKEKFDLIHFHNFKKISFSVLLWAKLLKIPSILTIYDYWFFCPNETLVDKKGDICRKFHGWQCLKCFTIPFKFKIFLIFRKIFFDFFLKNLNGYIFLSNASLEIGKNYGLSESKMKMIPQIFESFENEKKDTLSEENIILYIGWVQYRKGLHILIEALNKIVKKFENVILYVIGEIEKVNQDYVSDIFRMIKNKGIEKYIVIKGKLPQDEVKKYIKKAKIIVIPEQWENMSPVVLVEAMFNKKAIVASKIGGIQEFIEDGKNGFLCEPKHSDEFAEKIIKLLKNEELIKSFGEEAYKKAQMIWDNERNITEIIKFYNKLKNGKIL